MTNGITTIESAPPETQETLIPESAARVLLLGGVGALQDRKPTLGAELAAEWKAQDFRAAALISGETGSTAWLGQIGIDLVSLAAMQGGQIDQIQSALGSGKTVGAGETAALANSPVVLCVNDVRLGFLSFSERSPGGLDGRADILGLAVYDHVRLLLSQCDHVIVLVQAGLPNAELPLPEWRARYRRLIDVGASLVVDTGAARGWEAYKQGLVFYGLGDPTDGNSLALLLTLLQNGRLRYETRALECAEGEIRFSQNPSFKKQINDQNTLLLDNAAYQAAVERMCVRYYEEHEQPKKHSILESMLGIKGETARHEEEARLNDLLANESRRLMILRALAAKREGSI